MPFQSEARISTARVPRHQGQLASPPTVAATKAIDEIADLDLDRA